MRPTEWLVAEHDLILRMLAVLQRVAEKIEAGDTVEAGDLDKMVDFIRMFADRCHHGKEEDLLFEAMVEAGLPRSGGPIAVMLAEHDQGRTYVREMAAAAAAYRAGEAQAGSRFAAGASEYVDLLTEHIHKENHILYPMADRLLAREKQEQLLGLFGKVETERLGPGKVEQYHAMVEQFEQIEPAGS